MMCSNEQEDYRKWKKNSAVIGWRCVLLDTLHWCVACKRVASLRGWTTRAVLSRCWRRRLFEARFSWSSGDWPTDSRPLSRSSAAKTGRFASSSSSIKKNSQSVSCDKNISSFSLLFPTVLRLRQHLRSCRKRHFASFRWRWTSKRLEIKVKVKFNGQFIEKRVKNRDFVEPEAESDKTSSVCLSTELFVLQCFWQCLVGLCGL